jgi:DNA-nicking Smr family endonuclease
MRDEDLLAEALADVKPLRNRSKTVPRPIGIKRRKILAIPESENERLLIDFVQGKSEFEWSFHPEYQEGGCESRNRPLIKKLRRGGFSIQAELDLHGLTQREALAELEAFLKECRFRQFRCIRIVHGKGRRSRNKVPVLKKMVPKWLSSKRLARYVVAFASAPPSDGGVGATFVLLRNQ